MAIALRPPRAGHRHRALLGACVLTLLVSGGAWTAVRWSHRGAKAVSVSEAVNRFRAGANGTSDAGGALIPAAGVYTYAGSGTERLSFLNTKQAWGSTMPATVTRAAGDCWVLKVDFSTHHSQDWRYCARGGRLLETGGTTKQTFAFVAFSVSETDFFRCTTPGAVIRPGADSGTSAPITCLGRSKTRSGVATSKGTLTFLGRTPVRVGSALIDAYHVRSARTLSGAQRGTERSDSWFATRDGMLLKFGRSIDVRSPSPIGDVRYRENGSFVLTSTSPQR
jgi:hypothetical protein